MVFHGDSEFLYENFLKRYNTDLANDLGNLCNRSVNMMVRYFDGVIPQPPRVEEEIAALAREVTTDFENALSDFRFNSALEAAWRLVGRMNRYIEERTPWKQAKAGETEELAVTLYTCLEAVRVVTTLVAPVMPYAAEALWKQLGMDTTIETARWQEAGEWGLLPAGTRVPAPEPLFPRIQDTSSSEANAVPDTKAKKTQEKKQVTDQTPEAPAADAPAPEAQSEAPSYITIDDFMKIELRVANILAAEAVPNATKLLKLTVDLGTEQRTVLAGIAEMYQPEELVGRQVVVVANLQPRKMRGIESQGMLLAADVEGQAILLSPETQVPLGSRVR
jgi:methionyl-tRNA synthetase